MEDRQKQLRKPSKPSIHNNMCKQKNKQPTKREKRLETAKKIKIGKKRNKRIDEILDIPKGQNKQK